jgi:CDP-diacylglycerol pyrophosphatase
MASSNFDELTKALATGTSRRQTIKVIFTSILGGMLGFGSIDTAQAVDRRRVGALPCKTTSLCGSVSDDDPTWKHVQKRISDCKMYGGNYCDGVDTSKYQWVVGQDSSTNYTLFAGERVTGIECPNIWNMRFPDYWEFAWNAAKTYLPSQVRNGQIGLAINSKMARNRCQLHIHVSCIQAGVRTQLDHYYAHNQVALNPASWKGQIQSLEYKVGTDTKKHNFRLLYLKDLGYKSQNLFQLLRNNVVEHDNDMQYQTLIAIEGPKNGFYILNSMDHDHDPSFNGTGAGEELLNEKCS